MINLKGVITTVLKILSIIIVLYVFEITKAIASTLQGDTVPKNKGMLTLNIFKYFEPIGFFLAFFYGYGWGQPAPVSARNYKDRKFGTLITFSAPILVSVLLALLLNIGVNLLETAASDSLPLIFLQVFLLALSRYFIRAAVFNLIPIPPMSGYEILKCFLSPNAAFQYGQNAPLIQMGFLFLWFFGLITPILDSITGVLGNLLFG